jgi:hypothetical protein
MIKNITKIVWIVAVVAVLTACKKDDDPAPVSKPEAKTITNLHAPNDVIDYQTGQVVEEKPFVKFSFAKGQAVADGEAWDIAFKGTTIIVNGGSTTLDEVARDGQAAAAVLTVVFDEVGTVPASTEWKQDSDEGYAIPKGSGNGWYNYNPQTHVISPIPGRVLLFRDAAGKGYAKVEILSYYKDAPASPDPYQNESAYYTFRYVYQPEGLQFE